MTDPTDARLPTTAPNSPQRGYYARHLSGKAADEIEECSFTGLRDEIEMIRILLARTLEHIEEAETLDDHLYLLRAVNVSALTIARLLRASSTVEKDEGGDGIQNAIDTVLEEMTARNQHL